MFDQRCIKDGTTEIETERPAASHRTGKVPKDMRRPRGRGTKKDAKEKTEAKRSAHGMIISVGGIEDVIRCGLVRRGQIVSAKCSEVGLGGGLRILLAPPS